MTFLARNILGIIVAIAVLAVFVMLVESFITLEKTPEIKDFERINSEIKALLKATYIGPMSIVVPVKMDSGLNIVMYSSQNSPGVCRKNTCLCLYPKGEDKPVCVIYPEIKNTCNSTCGTVCVQQSKVFQKTSPTTVTIKRDCNEITLS